MNISQMTIEGFVQHFMRVSDHENTKHRSGMHIKDGVLYSYATPIAFRYLGFTLVANSSLTRTSTRHANLVKRNNDLNTMEMCSSRLESLVPKPGEKIDNLIEALNELGVTRVSLDI